MSKPFSQRRKRWPGIRSRASGLSVVQTEKGDLGWRVTDENGEPIKLHFGKLLDVDQLDPESPAYKASLRAIEQTLKKTQVRRAKYDLARAQARKRLGLSRRSRQHRGSLAGERD